MRPAPTRIAVTSRSANIEVVGSGTTFEVRKGIATVLADGTVSIVSDHASSGVEVQCAAGTEVTAGTSSGKVRLGGRLGAVRVVSGSGRVHLEHVVSAEVRTASANVTVEHCDGECRVVTHSGKVTIGNAGRAEVSSTNGRVDAGEVGEAAVRTVSGRVAVGARLSGRVDVRSMSGSVEVSVPAGCHPSSHLKSNSGKIRCDCPDGDDADVEVRTSSGAIRVAYR